MSVISEESQRREDRKDDNHWQTLTTARLSDVEAAVSEVRSEVAINTKITAEIKKNTDDIVEFFEAGRGTFKVLKVIGTMAKWITSVAAAIALLWLSVKGWSK